MQARTGAQRASWSKPTLPWILLGIWSCLFSLRRFLGGWIPLPHAAAVICGFVLAFAVVFAVVDTFSRAAPKWSDVATLLFALTLFCSVAGFFIFIPMTYVRVLRASEPAPFSSEKLEKIPELKPKAGLFAARFVYRELGVRAGYRSEDGSLIVYEPDSADVAKRHEKLESQRELNPLREQMADQSRGLQLQAILHLTCLPIAALVVAVIHMLRRKKAQSPNANALSSPNNRASEGS